MTDADAPAPETHRISDRVTVLIGFPDAHVEVWAKAARFVPAVRFVIEADELAAIPEIFEKARRHAAAVREKKS